MSLVNDMLRDLDTRQGGAAEMAGVAVLPAPEPGRSMNVMIVAAVIAIAVGLAMWLASTAPEPRAAVPVTDRSPASEPAADAAQAVSQAPSRVATAQSNIAALNESAIGLADDLEFRPASAAQGSAAVAPATVSQVRSMTLAGRFSFGQSVPASSASPKASTRSTPVAQATQPPVEQLTTRQAAPPPIPVASEPESAPQRDASGPPPVQSSQVNFADREREARMLIGAGTYLAAVDLLSAAPQPAVADNTRYFALLAAAQTSARRPAAAAQTYRSLVAVDPSNGTWWLGFGAALEASQQLPAARDALRRALASRDLRTDLRRQAAIRLQRLEQAAEPQS